MLYIESILKTFDGKVILDNVSLKIGNLKSTKKF